MLYKLLEIRRKFQIIRVMREWSGAPARVNEAKNPTTSTLVELDELVKRIR